VKPFLNWAGGKRWLVANHDDLLRVSHDRLVEPFVGSGAVFFHLEPSAALLSDANPRLIEAYTAVRDEPERVLDLLKVHRRRHSTEYYYHVRDQRFRTPATRAAQLIYLNRTCFNGLYRVNLQGRFNVPKGSKDAVIFPDDDFVAWSQALSGSELRACDFQKTIDDAVEGDFLYADPPYTVKHNMNNFVKYNEHIFSWSDQVRLRDALVGASRRGVAVVVSNADHPSIRELYSDGSWHLYPVSRHSRLAASSDHRKRTTELLILNGAAATQGQPDAKYDEADVGVTRRPG
jgi:DNA adenine methylase